VRGRVAGRLEHLPVAEVAGHGDTGDQLAVDPQRSGLAGSLVATLLDPPLQRLLGHPALARDLDPPQERLVGVGGGVVGVVRVQPDLAAGAFGDRRRLTAVVHVRMRAHHEPDVLDPQAGLVERALEMGHRARLVHAGVDEHDAVARSQCPRVAVRDARPRQRQPQTPHAGQHPLPSTDLPAPRGLAHRA
jgi:hypothetical protein